MTLRSIIVRTSSLTAFVLVGLAALPACKSKGEDVCNKYQSLCNGSTTTDAGTVTVTVKCDPDKFDDVKNQDEVSSCMDGAKDCEAAIGCLSKAKL